MRSLAARLLGALLWASVHGLPHCPHECPASSRIARSGFDSCGGSSHCGECEACLAIIRDKEEAIRNAAKIEADKKAAAEAAAAALISPPPPPPTIPAKDKLWLGECHSSCRKIYHKPFISNACSMKHTHSQDLEDIDEVYVVFHGKHGVYVNEFKLW